MIRLLFVCGIVAAIGALAVTGVEAGKTALDPRAIAEAGSDAEIVVAGDNRSGAPAVIVLRVDDARSSDYWSRSNIERRVPAGPFRFRIPVAELRTPRGRPIDRGSITLALVFSPAEAVDIEEVGVESPAPLASSHGAVLALDLGAPGSPVFPGFKPLTPDSPLLAGTSLAARQRPGADALISDGIEGVERVTLAPGPGRWRMVLWTEDPGEWEYLPHALERRIKINGRAVLERRLTPDRWIRDIYLAGREAEWVPGMTAWDAIGAGRGGRIETEVEIEADGGRIAIELAGSDRSATFLSGLLVFPAADTHVAAEVERRRRIRFDETWRVAPIPRQEADLGAERVDALPAAPGTPLFLTVEGDGVSVVAPSLNGRRLPTWHHAGYWRLTRPDTAATLLVPDDRHLRGDADRLPAHPALPRRHTITVRVPTDALPGLYEGRIDRDGGSVRFSIRVLASSLPPAGAAVGLYLDDLPTHAWFRTDPTAARVCAMTALRQLGLTGIAPPLATPGDADRDLALLDDAALARDLGFAAPLLAYTPFKRAADKTRLATIDRLLSGAGTPLFWSAADEISNHGDDLDGLRRALTEVRLYAPDIRLAGHLNAERDAAVADAFDAVLVNSGYGLTESRLADLRRRVAHVSLYNLDRPRLAAGAYLWRTGLDGYLQWHARMPTADPFDPTDGREADVAWLPPTGDDCPDVPDIDRGLIRMADGITDLRWLRWLDLQASQNATVAALRDEIRRRVPADWNAAKSLSDRNLSDIRQRIVALAR